MYLDSRSFEDVCLINIESLKTLLSKEQEVSEEDVKKWETEAFSLQAQSNSVALFYCFEFWIMLKAFKIDAISEKSIRKCHIQYKKALFGSFEILSCSLIAKCYEQYRILADEYIKILQEKSEIKAKKEQKDNIVENIIVKMDTLELKNNLNDIEEEKNTSKEKFLKLLSTVEQPTGATSFNELQKEPNDIQTEESTESQTQLIYTETSTVDDSFASNLFDTRTSIRNSLCSGIFKEWRAIYPNTKLETFFISNLYTIDLNLLLECVTELMKNKAATPDILDIVDNKWALILTGALKQSQNTMYDTLYKKFEN